MRRGKKLHKKIRLKKCPLLTSYQDIYLTIILKGYCHKIEDGYAGFQVLDLKNLGLPEHIFRILSKFS
jgi:hypothetical protein